MVEYPVVLTCPTCAGKYRGDLTHSHTSSKLLDERFKDCRLCHGLGAITCETCCGMGRVLRYEDGRTEPATLEAQRLVHEKGRWARSEAAKQDATAKGDTKKLEDIRRWQRGKNG